jgi:hypothetical protein
MPKLPVGLAIGAMLTLFATGFGPDRAYAASAGGATETPEQTTPQGEDPPGADDGAVETPPSEHKGVIAPPPTGDEGIHTDVPNPDAGHDEEIIPPSELPGADPNADPR